MLCFGVDSNGVLIAILVDANGKVAIGELPVLPAGTNVIGKVDINAELPAGTQNIGDVDIASELPAGTQNIGDVDIASALPAGSNLIGSIDANLYGRFGAAWQKAPMPWGYHGQVTKTWSNNNLAAGTNHVDSGAVPADRLWVITNLCFMYFGTPPTRAYMKLRDAGATDYNLWGVEAPGSGVRYDDQGFWVFNETDVIRLTIEGATATDNITCWATGYRVDLA